MGKRKDTCYDVDFETGRFFLTLKYDTGAVCTVISARNLKRSLTPENLERIKDFCEQKGCDKTSLLSASGHPFWGYWVRVDTARIGSSRFHDFHFYLVVENGRNIALLGFDFIDKTKRIIEPCGNCIMSQFDDSAYRRVQRGQALDGNELIAFIDSLTKV